MEDEFYTVGIYIAHKSCTFDGEYFSNPKHACIGGIDYLKQRCAMIDKINENIDVQVCSTLINEILEFPCIEIYDLPFKINFYHGNDWTKSIKFESYEEFYDHMYKHYPHLIKSHDIKIALKD
jgi:hypothetical protein